MLTSLDLRAERECILHDLSEYKLWRDNPYIGAALGPEGRPMYLAMMRRRLMRDIVSFRHDRRLVAESAAPRYGESALPRVGGL
ncbi:MAG: hypothetical protein IPI58_07745 [Alphaproteobacteria bacterium]|nr:MAG: hypothetical protein IPI58_07745 [Alphaproteobacteria bacterium]